MSKLNPKGKDYRVDFGAPKLAGGYGMLPAKQSPEAILRRNVMSCLLWEDLAYQSGVSVADDIRLCIPQVDPRTVANIAIEAREKQKLRHVPLFIAVHMAKHDACKPFIREVVRRVVTRPDQITDLLALYWKDGKKPLCKQLKLGLADAFQKFNEYQFAKYDRDNAIKLRDVMRICHPKPIQGKEELFKKINERTLATPDTWEVALSTNGNNKETWLRLLESNSVPDLAFLRNLRNMIAAKVPESIIRERFKSIRSDFLLPLNFFAALKAAPFFQDEIEQAMFKTYAKLPKLPGHTIFVMDVSGSMGKSIASKSEFNRLDAGAAMAVLAREQCESIAIYATAGDDGIRKHSTKRLSNVRGFGLTAEIGKAANSMGGGGIYTRQCLEFIKNETTEPVDRIIVFSDSQDCDYSGSGLPAPFGTKNYIVDVSSHTHGINYSGVWTAEISGWSDHFITYIAALEGIETTEAQDEL